MVFKRCSIGTKRPNVCQENIPHILHHHHQPELLRQGRMDPCFHVLHTKFCPYHLNVAAEIETRQTRQRFYNLLLSDSGDPLWIVASVSVLSWQEQHPVWSSAAVAHLLQGLTCCAFRDCILHILVVTSGYLSYCCLSIISNQSAHSPLTSDINKAFSSIQLPLTGYFLFFGPCSVNPRDGCVWKFQ